MMKLSIIELKETFDLGGYNDRKIETSDDLVRAAQMVKRRSDDILRYSVGYMVIPDQVRKQALKKELLHAAAEIVRMLENLA